MSIRLPIKRALVIGINYFNTEAQLNGCINDAHAIRDFLIEERGFHACQVTVMTDSLSHDSRYYPTRANILAQMRAAASEITQPGDLLFVHYSGHGSYQRQGWLKRWWFGDEVDGQDETICPVDCDTAGMIIDDELRRILVDALPDGAVLRAIFDCCHSGTLIDARYNFRLHSSANHEQLCLMENLNLRESACDALMLSGCLDSQTSADAEIDGSASGALTYAFLRYSRKYGPDASCPVLLRGIHRYLREQQFSQRPQISAGQRASLEDATFL